MLHIVSIYQSAIMIEGGLAFCVVWQQSIILQASRMNRMMSWRLLLPCRGANHHSYVFFVHSPVILTLKSGYGQKLYQKKRSLSTALLEMGNPEVNNNPDLIYPFTWTQ